MRYLFLALSLVVCTCAFSGESVNTISPIVCKSFGVLERQAGVIRVEVVRTNKGSGAVNRVLFASGENSARVEIEAVGFDKALQEQLELSPKKERPISGWVYEDVGCAGVPANMAKEVPGYPIPSATTWHLVRKLVFVAID